MSRKGFDPKECIGPLNTVKEGVQLRNTPVTKEFLMGAFKNCGLPTNCTFWTAFRSSKVLQEVSKGKYMFAFKDPIYVGTLAHIKKEYQKLLKRYKENCDSKKGTVADKEDSIKKDTTEGPVTEIVETPDLVKEAISFLKGKGYKILAPVGVVYGEI